MGLGIFGKKHMGLFLDVGETDVIGTVLAESLERPLGSETKAFEPVVGGMVIVPAIALGAVSAAVQHDGFEFFQCKACEAMGHKRKLIGCIGEYAENSWVLLMEPKHGNGALGVSNSDETSRASDVHCLPGEQEGIIMRQYAIDFVPVGLPEIEADIFEVR